MKHILTRALALLLTLLMLLAAFTGCGKHGQTMIEVGDYELSVNLYMLYLSRMKGSLGQAGEDVGSSSFWNSILSYSEGTTVAEFYNAKVLQGLKQIAASLYLYDELGLELPKETEDAIDEWIDALVEDVGEGSKAQLNSILSQFGANITVLRDASIVEAKLQQLKTHLYGEDGALLTALAKEEFYKDHYVRGRVLIINNYYTAHDRKDGVSVYYQADGVHIAYDTVNGVATDEKDDNGDVIYRVQKEDGSLGGIAYDKENGRLKYITDKDGNYQDAEYTPEEMEDKYKALTEIAEKCKDDPDLFLRCIEDYSDQYEVIEKIMPNGMYFAEGSYTTDSAFYTFAAELNKLEVGELVILNSTDGYYLLQRIALDDEAWNVSENAQWFTSLPALCVEAMLQMRAEDYMQYVKLDEELAKSASIADVAANTYY